MGGALNECGALSGLLAAANVPGTCSLGRDSPEVAAIMASYFASQQASVMARAMSTGVEAAGDLPMSVVKRIMKQDACDVARRTISADAVPLMEFTAEVFIGVVTKLAYQVSMVPDRRHTLMLKDLCAAVTCSSKFDFLIDVLDLYDKRV